MKNFNEENTETINRKYGNSIKKYRIKKSGSQGGILDFSLGGGWGNRARVFSRKI